MSVKIIQQQLDQYQPQNQLEQENAIKEITQEIAISGLSRAGFFKIGAFQGGTCLRILYGINRFSEDLDFALHKPDPSFRWSGYLKQLEIELATYGYQVQFQDRSSMTDSVKVGILKDDSIVNLLLLNYQSYGVQKTMKIKLEIDTNPPEGAQTEQKYINFPITVPVVAYNLPSLFAGKSNAILTRNWEKGRDWFDFIWYVSRKTQINYTLLSNSLKQIGPWKDQKILVNKNWYLKNIKQKILSLDWEKQKKDISRFLRGRDLDLLNLWSKEFFLDRVQMLSDYLN